jgi:hypothetical protein
MKTYVKIEAEDKKPAIKALRKLAIDMPKICVMDTGLKEDLGVDVGLGSGPRARLVTIYLINLF